MSRFFFFLLFFLTGISITYYYVVQEKKVLKVVNPVDLNPEMVDDSQRLKRKGYDHKIGDFSFKNQNGDVITQSYIEGKIHIAEYFFTTCGSICPIMNQNMKRLQEEFFQEKDIKMLSFTVNPEIDTIEQMKRYSIRYNANDNQWHFLTGRKDSLYSLARKSYFVLKPAESRNMGDAGSDFIHTNNFVLVDRDKRIRGYYDGTSRSGIDSLIIDINFLLKEK